jgi:CO/xanthine dehydrogenase Mo-binding subunit
MKSMVGDAFLRVDGADKVTGKGVYASDIRIPGLAHAKVLRSPYAHALVRSVEVEKARQIPGVLAILTGKNLQNVNPYYGLFIKDQPVVALEKVRYAGDIVAAVVATDEEPAEEALKTIEVEYQELPAVVTVEESLHPNAPLIHEIPRTKRDLRCGKGTRIITHEKSNIGFHFRYERGDVESAFRNADVVFEDKFRFPSAQHYPLESHVSVAHFEGDGLTVWSSTQTPFPLRQELCGVFGLPFSKVRVIVPYVGGGYGAKGGIRTEAIASLLSRLVNKPVRLAFDAEGTFRTFCQPDATIAIKTAVKKDGTFLGRRCEVYLTGGAYANTGPRVAQKMGYRAHGPYKIPHLATDIYWIYTNTVPAGAFRGFGGSHVVFAYESHADVIASRLGMDAAELRMKNLLGRGEEYAPGDTPIDCDLKGALKKLVGEIGWKTPSVQSKDTGIKRGKGIACGVKDGGGTNKPAHAMVKLLNDGSILVSSATVEIGQGARTAFVQIVSQEFSVSPDRVQVGLIDTSYTPYDVGTNSSSSTVVMGQALEIAIRDARNQLLTAAASLMGVGKENLRLSEGKIVSDKASLTFRELMRRYSEDTGSEIIGRGFFKVPQKDEVPLGYPSPYWEVGLGAAEVEVDEMTGEVKVLKYVSITDAGKMINPIHCRGQDEGAAVFGMGLSLSEELKYRDGQLANPNLVDYRLPRFRDIPRSFVTRILEEGGGSGPMGSKGMGEGSILPVAPAICNAVYNATGVRIYEVPLRGERVWTALAKGDAP